MYTIYRKFCARNTMLVRTVGSVAGLFVKRELLLAAGRFCLPAAARVTAVPGVLLRHPWASSSEEFKRRSMENGVNEAYI